MSFLKSGNLRESTGWIRQKLGPRNIQLLKTDGEVINELWLILEYYSEINEVGIKYLIANGIPRRKANNLFKHFQAYIRQAKNYYFSAQKLHQRSAALLYYYFFLNLAKAAILLNEPDIAGVRITHGIGCLPKNFKKIKNQTVKVLNDNGVFKKLYKFLFNIEITQQNISIKELFKYCSDISFQFKQDMVKVSFILVII